MQVKTVVLSLFVAVAAARSIDEIVADIPSCAKPCIDSASTKAGCAIADHNCQCNKIGELTSDSVVCVSQGCDAGDISSTFYLNLITVSAARTTDSVTMGKSE
jgi:hypothetical protein